MKQKIMDSLTHPVKCKLIMEIHSAGRVTAKQLAQKYKDIAQATLYRYLKQMTDDNILKVVEKNQIRGTIEKTYALTPDLAESIQVKLDSNSGDAYMQMFIQYILGFTKQFHEYCKKTDINIIEDKSGFSLVPIYATDEELTSVLEQYAKILEPLQNNLPTSDRKLRTIGLIITPPETYK
ncbi:hypothetical protein [Lacrimispora sp.]|uniref:hypothetical protein n=1 Tax=Lacrimispora sp. TaxID=2719234 RepID=UPI0028A93B21|nr:hypothetical protein [Lacrimispora sp.]